MRSMNYLRVILASLAAFVASSAWYTGFGGAMMEIRGVDPSTATSTGSVAGTMLFVVVQSLVVASMIAYFVARLGIVGWKGVVLLSALVWIFPASILMGSVFHENVPPMLAAIHAGDWLVKLLLMTVILSSARRKGRLESERRGWRVFRPERLFATFTEDRRS